MFGRLLRVSFHALRPRQAASRRCHRRDSRRRLPVFARALKVSFLLLSVFIGLFPGSALGSTSCPVVNVQILLGGSNGNDITGMTESRYVGQQAVLYAQYTLPSGVSANSQSWSVPRTTVGGFNSGTSGGPLPAQFNGQSTTFYWTVPANSKP